MSHHNDALTLTPLERRIWRDQSVFLEALTDSGKITAACPVVGINRETVRRWWLGDVLGFATRFDKAKTAARLLKRTREAESVDLERRRVTGVNAAVKAGIGFDADGRPMTNPVSVTITASDRRPAKRRRRLVAMFSRPKSNDRRTINVNRW